MGLARFALFLNEMVIGEDGGPPLLQSSAQEVGVYLLFGVLAPLYFAWGDVAALGLHTAADAAVGCQRIVVFLQLCLCSNLAATGLVFAAATLASCYQRRLLGLSPQSCRWMVPLATFIFVFNLACNVWGAVTLPGSGDSSVSSCSQLAAAASTQNTRYLWVISIVGVCGGGGLAFFALVIGPIMIKAHEDMARAGHCDRNVDEHLPMTHS